jgi:putative sterol carrier protein
MQKLSFSEVQIPLDQVRDRGGLTLVAARYFECGKKLMQSIRENFTDDEYATHGRNLIKTATDRLVKNHNLEEKFLHAAKNTTNVSKETKVQIWQALIKKTFHARAKVITKKHKEEKASRYAEGTTSTAFRTELSVKCKKTSVAKASSLKKGV